jgi:hypothetical protein
MMSPWIRGLEDCWYNNAHPQLLFTCYLRQKDETAPKNPTYRYGPDDIRYHLVFFSTFEELKLPISGLMERAGVTKLYEPSSTPCLYVAPASCMAGGFPLIPCSWLVTQPLPFLKNSASTRVLASQLAAVTLLQRMDSRQQCV